MQYYNIKFTVILHNYCTFKYHLCNIFFSFYETQFEGCVVGETPIKILNKSQFPTGPTTHWLCKILKWGHVTIQ
jgi:hypothetical protein